MQNVPEHRTEVEDGYAKRLSKLRAGEGEIIETTLWERLFTPYSKISDEDEIGRMERG